MTYNVLIDSFHAMEIDPVFLTEMVDKLKGKDYSERKTILNSVRIQLGLFRFTEGEWLFNADDEAEVLADLAENY